MAGIFVISHWPVFHFVFSLVTIYCSYLFALLNFDVVLIDMYSHLYIINKFI